jgi:ABC-2 type transport system ATP-binding protein
VSTLSRGYRQRLGVAQAILHGPKILILDEPTNGLDPTQIQHMRELIRELARDATVMISTHILQEVEAVCERVLIMRGGRLALDSRLGDIGRDPRLMVTLDRIPAEAAPRLAEVPGVSAVTLVEDDGERRRFALETADPAGAAPAVARAVTGQGWALYGLAPERRDLEALFGAVNAVDGGAAGAQSGEAAHV